MAGPVIRPDADFPDLLQEMQEGVQALNRNGLVIYGELSADTFDIDLTPKGETFVTDETPDDTPASQVFVMYLEALDTGSVPHDLFVSFIERVKAASTKETGNLLRAYYDNASSLPVDPIPRLPEILLMYLDPGIENIIDEPL